MEDELTLEVMRSKRCPRCNITFRSALSLQQHFREDHEDYFHQFDQNLQVGTGSDPPLFNISLTQSAIDNTYLEYEADLGNIEIIDVQQLFKSLRYQLIRLMKAQYEKSLNFKIQFTIDVQFYRQETGLSLQSNTSRDNDTIVGDVRNVFPTFTSFLLEVNNIHEIAFVLTKVILYFRQRIEEFTNFQSGFIFKTIRRLRILLTHFEHISGGIIKKFQLPSSLNKKLKNLINVASDDFYCFKRAIYSHPHFTSTLTNGLSNKVKRRRLENVRFYDSLINDGRVDWSGIAFPFSLKHVNRFEKNNPDIALCIIGYDESRAEETSTSEYTSRIEENTVDTTIDSVIESLGVSEDDDEEEYEGLRSHSDEYQARVKLQKHIRQCCTILHTCDKPRKVQIDLMLIHTQEGNHFINIQNLHGLLVKPGRSTSDTCRHCLHSFRKEVYSTHLQFCAKLGFQKTNFPKEKFLSFSQFKRTIKIPFLVFADFESNMKNVEHLESPTESGTTKLQAHVPVGYHWTCVNYDHELYKKQTYRASQEEENVAKRLLLQLLELSEEISEIVEEHERIANEYMLLTEEDKRNLQDPRFRRRQECFFCHKTFFPGDTIVRHHNHSPPFEFQGLAHQSPCNIKAQVPKNELIVIFHNLKGYDSKLLLEAVSKDVIDDIEIIPSSSEKFLSIIVRANGQKLKFIDSLMFLNSSLEKLVNEMDKDRDFSITRKTFEHLGDNAKLLLHKGLYPYSYMDSIEKFNETEFPDFEHFRDQLKEEDVSLNDYYHALGTWHTLEIQNLGEWHDLYVETDASLLCDVFLRLRNVMYKSFGLDISWYFSLAMFAYDALLKTTKISLENIVDPTMHTWLESSIRGGLVSVGELRAYKSNNPMLPPGEYKPDEPTSWIIYLDINNQYGKSLSDSLPLNSYKWVSGLELQKLQRLREKFINSMKDDGPIGMFIECDILIPKSLHSYLNAYPPLPYKRCVESSEVSEYMKQFGEDLNIGKTAFKTERLIADLLNKKNYVCHYRALKYYIKLGCKVIRVHRAVSFRQSQWLKPFIDYNTKKRQEATSPIEILFWKSLNCFSYGKFIEDKRKRQNIRIVMNREKALMYNRKPTIQSVKIIHKDLVLITLKKLEVTLDRPIACGVACLDLSKLMTFGFHYDYMLPKYGERQKLLYSDTDSLVYGVETENIYQDCKDNENDWFDMSAYDKNDPVFGIYYSSKNKRVLGYLKDEFANKVITHMVVSKPKMYVCRFIEKSICSITGEPVVKVGDKKKAKGVPRVALEKRCKFEDFVDSILEPIQTYAENTSIRSFKQKLYTIHSVKRAINGFDVKRHILADSVTTLAFGNVDIPLYEH